MFHSLLQSHQVVRLYKSNRTECPRESHTFPIWTNQVFACPALYLRVLNLMPNQPRLPCKVANRVTTVPNAFAHSCSFASSQNVFAHACNVASPLPLFRPEPGLLQSLIFASNCNFLVKFFFSKISDFVFNTHQTFVCQTFDGFIFSNNFFWISFLLLVRYPSLLAIPWHYCWISLSKTS